MWSVGKYRSDSFDGELQYLIVHHLREGFNAAPSTPVTVNGHTLDYVEDFTYLGSLVSKENAMQKDIKARLAKAHSVFVWLQSIWKSNEYSL